MVYLIRRADRVSMTVAPHPTESRMPRHLAALLAASVFCLAAAPPAPKGPEVVEVTSEQLWKDPGKYHGKLVRIEGVVEDVTQYERSSQKGRPRYDLSLKGVRIYVDCEGEPSVAKGDRVRVTGTFTHDKHSFLSRQVVVVAGGVLGADEDGQAGVRQGGGESLPRLAARHVLGQDDHVRGEQQDRLGHRRRDGLPAGAVVHGPGQQPQRVCAGARRRGSDFWRRRVHGGHSGSFVCSALPG
jgi:hypothetical protein